MINNQTEDVTEAMIDEMAPEAVQEPPESPQEPLGEQEPADLLDDAPEGPEGEADTFPRDYVEKLRKEAADARVKAKRADELAEQLFHSRVAALGRLADPSDLIYDEAMLDDAPALEAAVDDLLARKPHLASRRLAGNVGQGVSGASSTVDLAGLLRARA